MTDARGLLTLEPLGPEPEVGRWLAAMEDGRRDTLHELDGVTSEMIDWRPAAPLNSIGVLLYHIALIEADWLLDDIQGRAGCPDGMPSQELHAPRARARYDVSPAWVLHHLLQHEAKHRSHIAWLRDTYPGV